MSTRKRSCRDLRTPQSAEEQADLTEHSEQFESENTPTDSTEESILDPQWHKMPRQARLSFNRVSAIIVSFLSGRPLLHPDHDITEVD
jgi:hypothetical protein